MTVWKPKSAAAEPMEVMTKWLVYEVEGLGIITRHVVGNTGYEGRVSSKIVTFDEETNTATTASGRKYVLNPIAAGYDPDANYVWNIWKNHSSIKKDKLVVDEYIPLDMTHNL
jgi:hypothetical protein